MMYRRLRSRYGVIGMIAFGAVALLGTRLVLSQIQRPDRFQLYDKNGDGQVTREESGSATWFDQLDRDRDGVITRLEAARAAFSNALSKRQAQRDVGRIMAYDKDRPGPVRLSNSLAFTDLRFTRDWIPGTTDRNGKLMTGTECNYIVAHGGRLYAAVSMWNHDPAAPNPGPGVLVKQSAAAPWEVDVQFAPPSLRVAVLASLTFTTDAQGQPLDKPVGLLVAGGSVVESRTELAVFIRDDATGKWVKSVLAARGPRDGGEIRLLAVHRDRVTGVDRLLAAVTNGNVYSGGFDPSVPGQIRWESEPELSGRLARIMSIGSANGDAYLAVDISPDSPKNGGLFRRVDGAQPRWEWVGEWGSRIQHRGVAWARGLTTIPDPDHPAREQLLCSREVDGVIEVIDPQRNHEARVEFDLRKHFGGLVGAREGQRVTTIFAYNEMTPAVHPETGERVHLIGGGVMPSPPGDDPKALGAWYLVRHADGRYGTGRVFDPEVTPAGHGGLRCVRTICVSPFPEDRGRVVYFGGFDGGDLGTGMRHRDTAWIYRARLLEMTTGRPGR